MQLSLLACEKWARSVVIGSMQRNVINHHHLMLTGTSDKMVVAPRLGSSGCYQARDASLGEGYPQHSHVTPAPLSD